MLSQELMRNAKAPSAFDIPTKTVGRTLQRDRARASTPSLNQNATYTTKGGELRTPHTKRGGS